MVNLQLHLIGKQTDKGHIARKKYMPVAHVVGIFSAGINQYHFHPERQTTGNVDHDISWAFGILKKIWLKFIWQIVIWIMPLVGLG